VSERSGDGGTGRTDRECSRLKRRRRRGALRPFSLKPLGKSGQGHERGAPMSAVAFRRMVLAVPNPARRRASPQFWTALRQAQSLDDGAVPTDTVGALIDAFEADWPKLRRKIAESTQYQYRRQLRRARKMWGSLLAKGLRPAHVQRAMQELAGKPGAANGFLAAMQALSKWGRAKDLLDYPLTDGVEAYRIEGGHRPWSDEQIACADQHLTGMIGSCGVDESAVDHSREAVQLMVACTDPRFLNERRMVRLDPTAQLVLCRAPSPGSELAPWGRVLSE
jgi:hypothetical protein